MEPFSLASHPLITSFDDPETELSYLDGLSGKTSLQIDQLLQFLARVHRRSNQLRSPIYTLPTEVLSYIFQNTRSSYQTGEDLGYTEASDPSRGWDEFPPVDCSAVVLSSICSHWRQVALDTPKLWTSVTLRIQSRKVPSHASLLQHHLTQAKSLDISLNIIFSANRNPRLLESISHILFSPKYLDRIKTLRLKNPPPQWIPLLPQLSRVQTLCLIYPRSLRGDTHLNLHSQSLRRLHLAGGAWISVDFSEYVALIRQCPNLIGCYSHYSANQEGLLELSSNHPLVFNHLTSFTWSVSAGINDGTIAQNIFLPALRRLRLIAPDFVAEDPVIGFIQKHSKTLLSLELEQFAEWTIREYTVLIRHDMPCLLALTVTAQLSSLPGCIKALSLKEEEQAEGRILLPKLKSLRLNEDGMDDPDTDMDRLAPLTLEMLQMRKAGDDFEFEVDIPDMGAEFYQVVWPEEVQESFKSYLANHRVKVTQNSEIPEFLESGPEDSSDSSSDR
ncbi:hypothetical protein D9756_002154 [Leucocoprinus leucothites]|uniref:F-box domain-containing protein n=1 Tax=Leucocoprinus leucothites TaxID=201217 RepID=A0A8H5GC05_9AGAR|nr:hypothetical protein D9756_002154 [Leucoagaricus leucothites]